jgi:transcriptional regulator with XRE-family HTH domain
VIQKVIQKVISRSRTLMDDTPTFGIWLKRRRKALDLTQAALAQLVGCSVVSIRKFEGDEQPPSRQLAELLATQLQIPPNERVTFIQFARVGLDSAPPTLPLPAEARLPQPMGATPAPEHATPTAAPSILATHATPLIRDLPPLVGRSAEWQTLQAVWAAARQGHAQLAVIIGEAGIGKTRLAEELLAQASQQGALTAQAHTYATAGRLTYAPLIAWLRTPALKQRLGQLRDADLTELARLMPELLSERVGLAPPTPMTESWHRLRLFEALMRAVLADQQPLLLMLDDLQWCDQETLDWLHKKQVAAIVTDTWGAEVRPNETEDTNQPWHWIAIPIMGLTVGEIFDLGALAKECAADKRYEFMFVAPALPITGGVGSPVRLPTGLPRNSVAWVQISHAKFARHSLYAAITDQRIKSYRYINVASVTIRDGKAVHTPIFETREVSTSPLTIQVAKNRQMTVKTVDRDGGPVAAVGVFATSGDGATGTSAHGTTDTAGQVRLALPPGEFKLSARPPRTSDFVVTSDTMTVN